MMDTIANVMRRPTMRAVLRKVLPLAYLAAIGWVNVYVCREMFFTEHTGYMNSMQGTWIAMARLAPVSHWFKAQWWPYWYGGMPYEYAYSPLIPALTAGYAEAAGVSAARAYHTVSGFFYCLGPVVLFVVVWQLTRAPGYSFAAALAYSLTAVTELVVPDGRFSWVHFRDARRLALAVVWDETPHLAALSFALLAALFFSLALRTRRRVYYLYTGTLVAVALLANPFGGVDFAMAVVCLIFAWDEPGRKFDLLRAGAVGALAYVLVSPWFPPSLIETIRFNAQRFEGGWTAGSLAVLLGVMLGWVVLWRGLIRWGRDGALRFFLLFAYVMTCIPVVAAYAGRYLVTQPLRYKVEMELAVVVAIAFASRVVVEKIDPKIRAVLVLFLLWPAAEQVIRHRRFAKQIIRPVDITETVEYQVAKRGEERLAGQRVLMPGSIGHWLNAFTETHQFHGGHFSTAPNWPQQVALYAAYGRETGDESITWLKAFGVQAIAVSGRDSREFWKPYAQPEKFEGRLPVMWREEGTTMYRIPQASASLAHVVPQGALVRAARGDAVEFSQVKKYVAALDAAASGAEFRWEGTNRAVIRTDNLQKGQVVSVQINYHPGWRARMNGKPARTFRDGLGLLVVSPECEGVCEVELRYEDSTEYVLCRIASALVLLGAAIYAAPRLRARGAV